MTETQEPALPYAGFVARLLSHLIDWLVLAIPVAVISSRFLYVSLIIALLYYPVFEGSRVQATIGKRAMNLIVTDEAGNRITVKQSLIRFVGTFASSLFFFLGYFIFFFTKKKQTLHDLFAETVVIQGRREGNLGEAWVDQLRTWAR